MKPLSEVVRQALFQVWLPLAAGACGAHSAVSLPAIRLMPDTVDLAIEGGRTLFRVTALVRNNSELPFAINSCGPDAQRKEGGKWETVWSPMCASAMVRKIEPGDSLLFPVTVVHPFESAPAIGPGTYRLRFGIGDASTHVTSSPALRIQASRVFVVRDRRGLF